MSKKVLVISSSLRTGSNSELLAEQYALGAKQAGNEVELISLKGKNINFCRGCLACQKLGSCVIKDDSNEIVEKMKAADVLVFASGVYYYSISGQLKTLLDRANPLYSLDYNFRKIVFISCAAEDEETTVSGSVKAIQGWIDCFEKAELTDVIFAGGADGASSVREHKAFNEAYELGLKA